MSTLSTKPTTDYPTAFSWFFREAAEVMIKLADKDSAKDPKASLVTHIALVHLHALAAELKRAHPDHPDLPLAQKVLEVLPSTYAMEPSLLAVIAQSVEKKEAVITIKDSEESDPVLSALSLDYPSPFEFGGLRYPSALHAFYAQLFHHHRALQENISALKKSELAAFLLMHFSERRPDWESPGLKERIMRDVLFAKFDQNPELAKVLLTTYDSSLAITGISTDTFWTCENSGRNTLGILLMQVREKLGGQGVVEKKECASEEKSIKLPKNLCRSLADQLEEIAHLNQTADEEAYTRHATLFRKPEHKHLSRCPEENFPFDDTLVPLSTGTLINANLVLGRQYIATQAPLKHAEEDFWQMIIEQGSTAIVALNELSDGPRFAPCYAYWPANVGETREAGRAKVKLLSPPELVTDLSWRQIPYTETPHGFVIRKLEVDLCDKKRIITHYQYLHWQDRQIGNIGCVLALAEKILATEGALEKPPVIHCAAGVGRTATFLVILDELRALKEGKEPDVKSSVERLRNPSEGRYYKMVQSDQQYAFCYAAMQEAAAHLG